jgi:nicotinamidase-related amidase
VPAALLVIDMLNPYEHRDADPLKRSVAEILSPLQELIVQAQAHDILTVYVNDNHGDWSAARRELTQRALDGAAPELVKPIAPPEGAPFVVKARHSIFYGTQVEYLLGQAEADPIVLTGQVTEQCILYSALDAYVRHLNVVVPRDCVAHIHPDLAKAALRMMEVNMRAKVLDRGSDALTVLS